MRADSPAGAVIDERLRWTVQNATTPNPLGRPAGSDTALTRRRILVAAVELVAELGYRGATMRTVASSVGLTIGSVFYHFGSKADLIAAAHAEVIEPLLERTYTAAWKETGFLPAVVAWLEAGGDVLEECPSLARFGAALLHAPNSERGVQELHQRTVERQRDVLAQLARADAENLARVGQQWEAVADAVYAMMTGLTDIAATGDVARFQAARAAMIGLLRRSIGPESLSQK